MGAYSLRRIFILVPAWAAFLFIFIFFIQGHLIAQEIRSPAGGALPEYARKIHIQRKGPSITWILESTRNQLPNIMLTGYWPPTNEMIRRFSPDPIQNPLGWIGNDWENRGYNVYAFFPEFPNGLGKGEGDLEVDYQDTSADFWLIAGQVNPVAVITFGRGYPGKSWELEWRHRNLIEPKWYPDYLTPTRPTPAPPDANAPAGYIRYSTLPVEEIADAVNDAQIDIDAYVDFKTDSGAFLCEYVGYHASWYHDLHVDPSDPARNISSGHIHVGEHAALPDAIDATKITLRKLIEYLDQPLVPNTRILHERAGGAVAFDLNGGTANANRNYLLLGSLKGTSPGILLPGGTATLPLNWDLFTGLTINLLNTPFFSNFMGTLDPEGHGSATFNTLTPLPGGLAGETLHFAYALSPRLPDGWFASNPAGIWIVP
jgi:pyrrolidone-carboxylate peptidase